MATYNEFQGLVHAIELKSALQEVDNRHSPELKFQKRSISEMAGIRKGAYQSSSIKLPIYDEKGKLFAANLIDVTKSVITTPGNIEEGTLIHFENNKGTTYGLVVEPPTSSIKKRAYVKTIVKAEADELIAKDPNIPQVQMGNSALGNIEITKLPIGEKIQYSLSIIFDPPKKAIFETYSKIHHLILQKKSLIIDSLLWVYLILLILFLSFLVFIYMR